MGGGDLNINIQFSLYAEVILMIKRYCSSLIKSISIVAILISIASFSLSTVKAETETPVHTTSLGSYFIETSYNYGSNPMVAHFGIGGQGVDIPQANGTALHFRYNFNEAYSGSISIEVTTSGNFKLEDCCFYVENGYFVSTTALDTTSKKKTFTIGFDCVYYIDFLLIHFTTLSNIQLFDSSTNVVLNTSAVHSTYDDLYYLDNIDTKLLGLLQTVNGIDSTVDYYLSGMNASLSQIYRDIHEMADYQIDSESVYAYYFSAYDSSNGLSVQYGDGSVSPTLHVPSNGRTATIIFPAGSKFYYYCYCNSNTLHLTANHNYVSVSYSYISPVIGGRRLLKVVMENTGSTQVNEWFNWSATADIIPLYFGTGRNMSPVMQSITGFDSENLTTDLLTDILASLQELVADNADPQDVETYNNIVNTVSTFIRSITNLIPSAQSVGDDASDVGVSWLLDFADTAGVVHYVYGQFVQTFPFIKIIVYVGLLCIVVKVFL